MSLSCAALQFWLVFFYKKKLPCGHMMSCAPVASCDLACACSVTRKHASQRKVDGRLPRVVSPAIFLEPVGLRKRGKKGVCACVSGCAHACMVCAPYVDIGMANLIK